MDIVQTVGIIKPRLQQTRGEAEAPLLNGGSFRVRPPGRSWHVGAEPSDQAPKRIVRELPEPLAVHRNERGLVDGFHARQPRMWPTLPAAQRD